MHSYLIDLIVLLLLVSYLKTCYWICPASLKILMKNLDETKTDWMASLLPLTHLPRWSRFGTISIKRPLNLLLYRIRFSSFSKNMKYNIEMWETNKMHRVKTYVITLKCLLSFFNFSNSWGKVPENLLSPRSKCSFYMMI